MELETERNLLFITSVLPQEDLVWCDFSLLAAVYTLKGVEKSNFILYECLKQVQVSEIKFKVTEENIEKYLMEMCLILMI